MLNFTSNVAVIFSVVLPVAVSTNQCVRVAIGLCQDLALTDFFFNLEAVNCHFNLLSFLLLSRISIVS